MKLSLRHLMAGLGTALFLAACGGGGGGDDTPPPPPVNPPTAVISASAQSVPIGTVVTLDGSGSTTPNNGTITYEWTLSDKPEGSAISLSGTQATASFTPDVEGEYVVQLTVHDGTASGTATQTITATNPNPVAVISPSEEVSVLLGNTVTLDGSSSRPPTGGDPSALRYEWTLLEKPEGDETALTDTGAARVSFLAATEGIYRLRLVVRYGELSSQAEVRVLVNTSNSAPVAAAKVLVNGVELESTTASNGNITITETIYRDQTITLDASASHDADGDALQYRWSFPLTIPNSRDSGRPKGSQAVINGATSTVARFVPDAVGVYYVDLTVYDQSVASTQRITIRVIRDPADARNADPVAVLWDGVDSYECETGMPCSVSAIDSYDVDGDQLTYSWVWWNNENEIKKYATGVTLRDPEFYRSKTSGSFTFELTVTDDRGGKSETIQKTLIVKIGANTAPVARINVASEKILTGETIEFDGTASTDGEGDEMNYAWVLVDRPDGSSAELHYADSVNPRCKACIARVVADKPGIYTAQLQVTDVPPGGGNGLKSNIAIASVFAKSRNNPPVIDNLKLVASGSKRLPPAPGQAVALRESGTTSASLLATFYDPDKDSPLYYFLSIIEQPGSLKDISGSEITRTGVVDFAGAPFASLAPLSAGDYSVELLVSDGVDSAEAKTLRFTAVNRQNYPSLLLETAVSIPIPGVPILTPVNWSQILFPVERSTKSYLSVRNTADGSLGAGLGAGLRVMFRLTAYDKDYTISNLSATSSKNGYAPAFVGLNNGQVIRKGSTVEFYITRPEIADEATLAAQLDAVAKEYGRNSEEYSTELKRIKEILYSYQFTWRFGVLESPDFTFVAGSDF